MVPETIHRRRLEQTNDGRIELFKRGSRSYEKVSYPLRCGIYHEVLSRQWLFHFNLNHQIIRLAARSADWPHPHEWLKRTVGNDWIYYSTGGYTGVFETTGEFYLPNLPYPTNNHMGGKPHQITAVAALLNNWFEYLLEITRQPSDVDPELQRFFTSVKANTPARLTEKAAALHRIIDGPVSVLPPDSRHVDYQVIPLNVARGCLYKCAFCRVKNQAPFEQLSAVDIDQQIAALKTWFSEDLLNFNGLFLGQHDALRADRALLCHAIDQAHRELLLGRSWFSTSCSFWFGSVTSLLAAEQQLFDDLEKLPGLKYINIGLESADQQTLDLLGKPVAAADVVAAFRRAQEINNRYETIEITANFVADEQLPEAHYITLEHLIHDLARPLRAKGAIYLSSLRFAHPTRARLFDFYRLKRLSRLPLFMYTIQRL